MVGPEGLEPSALSRPIMSRVVAPFDHQARLVYTESDTYVTIHNPLEVLMNCQICNNKLEGRQKRFCSRKCLNRDINHRHKDYACQKLRGKTRKQELLANRSCSVCGYSKSIHALHFHHLDPKTKSFGIDIRQCSNRSMDILLAEVAKCIVLCANCHAEEHWDTV